MQKLLSRLRHDHPSLQFVEGKTFSWSPSRQTITYNAAKRPQLASWSLLHEVGHAQLEHNRYNTDFELLLLEVAAWDQAKQLAATYDIAIDEDHIQDCIDTYRDWLYQRSACPQCSNTSLQQDSVTYRCFNCEASWTVTASRFCRPYRLTAKQQKTPAVASLETAGTTFLQRLGR